LLGMLKKMLEKAKDRAVLRRKLKTIRAEPV
jgi:hypothetical protein